jgi:hypothetical protein
VPPVMPCAAAFFFGSMTLINSFLFHHPKCAHRLLLRWVRCPHFSSFRVSAQLAQVPPLAAYFPARSLLMRQGYYMPVDLASLLPVNLWHARSSKSTGAVLSMLRILYHRYDGFVLGCWHANQRQAYLESISPVSGYFFNFIRHLHRNIMNSDRLYTSFKVASVQA